jgi:hypothetical protein
MDKFPDRFEKRGKKKFDATDEKLVLKYEK